MDGDNAARMVEEEDGGGGDPFEDDDSISSEPSFHEEDVRGLMMIKENDPSMTSFGANSSDQDITSKAWARIGRDISINTHLAELQLTYGALNEKKMQSFYSED